MRSRHKRQILIMMLVLTAFLMSSCTQKVNQDSTENNQPQLYNERITVAFCQTEQADALLEVKKEVFKNISGVDVDFLSISESEWSDKMNKLIDSGNIPDVIICRDRDEVSGYVFQNILADVSYDKIKKYAPKLYDGVSDTAWFATRFNHDNWGIPVMGTDMSHTSVLVYNKDWLTNLGFSSAPATIEEMEMVFEAFTYGDPDRNGIDDTYAISPDGRDNVLNMLPEVFRAFGADGDMWLLSEQDTLEFGITKPEARAALAVLQKWYDKGYIDPHFIYDDQNAVKHKWKNNKIGVMRANVLELSELNAQYNLELGRAPGLHAGAASYSDYGETAGMVVFGKQMEKTPELVNKILHALNRILTEEESAMRFFAGDENIHWQWDNGNGFKERVRINAGDGKMSLTYELGQALVPTKDILSQITQGTVYSHFYELQGHEQLQPRTVPWICSTLTSENKVLLSDAGLVAEKWVIEFIIGEKSLDEFKSFVEEWLAAGGRTISDTVNKSYKAYLEELKVIADDRS